FTVYPEAKHDSWTETYNNPKVYEWLLKQKRKGRKR
ncbi:MAG TPA: phospholipase, partial [Sumerlaeia bacterium]|nr:phospholipase [Sumerlaeia bacterium]